MKSQKFVSRNVPQNKSNSSSGLDAVTWEDVANSDIIPVFLPSLYLKSIGNERPNKNDTLILWEYIESLTNESITRNLDTTGTIKTILQPIKEAVSNAALVISQVLKQTNTVLSTEIQFYLWTFFNEINISKPTDFVRYIQKGGVEFSDYIMALVKASPNLNNLNITTKIQKSTQDILIWFAKMMKSVWFVVYEGLYSIVPMICEEICQKMQHLSYMFHDDFSRINNFDYLDNLQNVADILSKSSVVKPESKRRIQESAKLVKDYQEKLQSANVGTVDPSIIATVMRRIYHEQFIDRQYLIDVCYQRLGKNPRKFFEEVTAMADILYCDIFSVLSEYAYLFEKSDLESCIQKTTQYIAGKDWFWGIFGGSGDDEKDEEEKKEPIEMDEETKKDRQRAERRKQALDIIDELMQRDNDNPNNIQVYTNIAQLEELKTKLHVRLDNAKMKLQFELTMDSETKSIIRDMGNQSLTYAAKMSIQKLGQANVEEVKKTVDNLKAIVEHNEHITNDRTKNLLTEIELVTHMISSAEKRILIINNNVRNYTFDIGKFILVIGGVFLFLLLIWKVNSNLVLSYTNTFEQLDKAAKTTGTSSLLNLWTEKWNSEHIIPNYITTTFTGNEIKRIASDNIRKLNIFDISIPQSFTPQSIADFMSAYNERMASYVNTLMTLKFDTASQIGVLAKAAAGAAEDAAETIVYEQHLNFIKIIEKAIESYTQSAGSFDITAVTTEAAMTLAISKRTMLMKTAASNVAIALQYAQDKMWTTQLSIGTESIASTIWSILKSTPMIGASVFAGFNFLRAKVTPDPGSSFTPLALMNVMGPGGRSEAWMDALQKTGTGMISLGVGIPVAILTVIWHVANYWARISVGRADPIFETAQFFGRLAVPLSGLWMIIWQDLANAAASQQNLQWTIISSFASVLLILFPGMGVLQKIHEFVSRKLRERQQQRPPPQLQQQQQQQQQQQLAPASITNPQQLQQQQQQQQTPTTLRIEHNDMKRIFEDKRKKDAIFLKKVEVLPDSDDESTNSNINCSICTIAAAKHTCSHCLARHYCSETCALLDWSKERKQHYTVEK